MRFLQVSSETGKITVDLCHNAELNLWIYQSWYETLWGNNGVAPHNPTPSLSLFCFHSARIWLAFFFFFHKENGENEADQKKSLHLEGLKGFKCSIPPEGVLAGPQSSLETIKQNWEWGRGRRNTGEGSGSRIFCPLSSPRILSSWSHRGLCRGGRMILENVQRLSWKPKWGVRESMCSGVCPTLKGDCSKTPHGVRLYKREKMKTEEWGKAT